MNFAHLQTGAGGNVDQYAARTTQVNVVKQGACHCLFGSGSRPVVATRRRRTHHCHSHFRHDGSHVCEVDIDQTGAFDHLGDSSHRAMQDRIGCLECIEHGNVVTEHLHQLVVGDNNQRIDMLGKFLETVVGDLLALAFECKRLGNHGYCEDAQLTGCLRNHRCRAGASASTHASGEKQHVGTFDQLDDPLAIFHRGLTADFRIGAGTQSLGDARAELQQGLRPGALESLGIGIGADKFHTLDTFQNHVINGVATTTTHTKHLDDRFLCLRIHYFKHFLPPLRNHRSFSLASTLCRQGRCIYLEICFEPFAHSFKNVLERTVLHLFDFLPLMLRNTRHQ